MKALAMFAVLAALFSTPASAHRAFSAHCMVHATRKQMVSVPDSRYYHPQQVYSDNMWTG
jgi:hypothetical protein